MRVIPPARPRPRAAFPPAPALPALAVVVIAATARRPRGDFSDDRPNSIRCSTAKSARSSPSSTSRSASRSRSRSFSSRHLRDLLPLPLRQLRQLPVRLQRRIQHLRSEASAPLESGTTQAATVTQHSKHHKQPQITHPASVSQSTAPADVSTPHTNSEDLRREGVHMDSSSARRIALMSIHPGYAEAILSGRERAEFRKRPLAEDVRTVLIYATAPVSAMSGWFTVQGHTESRTGKYGANCTQLAKSAGMISQTTTLGAVWESPCWSERSAAYQASTPFRGRPKTR